MEIILGIMVLDPNQNKIKRDDSGDRRICQSGTGPAREAVL
jgi:hypothetical protein